MTVVADTGALYAAYDDNDKNHPGVRQFLASFDEQLVVPPLVLAELDYLASARAGERHRAAVIAEIMETCRLAAFTEEMFQSAADLAAAWGEIGLGVTDASVMVTAYEYRTRDILTVDQRHYRAVRPNPGTPGTAFRLLPFDA